MTFPPGITVERATSRQGGARGVPTPVPLCPPPCRTSGQKGGGALTTSTPLARRAVAPSEGGTCEAQPRFASPQRSRGIRVVPRLVWRFVKVANHNGEGLRPLRRGIARIKIMSPLDVLPRLKGGHPSDGICVTPRGGNRRSFQGHWVSLYLARFIPASCEERDRDRHSPNG